MKKNRSMRPQDIVVLLKVLALGDTSWRLTDLAGALFLSQSEVSEALERNRMAGLIDEGKRHVARRSVLDFVIHGIKYVFPQRPGPLVRGTPTAHSAPPLSELVQAGENVYVWPDADGQARGEAIEPLYRTVPRAAKIDVEFYELAALVDAIRVGKPREVSLAAAELKKRILPHE